MRLNYNFAFKNSKLKPWQRPAPPNLLFSDATIENKIKYIYIGFNKNSNLYYPSTFILIVSLGIQIFSIYPKRILKTLENDHYQYTQVANKISNINSSKKRFKQNIKNIEEYFSQPTTSYLFAFYLQNSIPQGLKLNNYYFSDNGFDISASAYNIETLNEFLTLIIESPIIIKETVKVSKINRKESSNSVNNSSDITFEIALYGQTNKLNMKERENLYRESEANGLLKKLKRFNFLNTLLGS